MNAGGVSKTLRPSLRTFAVLANRSHCGDMARCPKSPLRETSGSSFLVRLGYCMLLTTHCGAALAGSGSAPVSDGSMLQVVLGLGFVLALMGVLAWLLKRFGGMRQGAVGTIKVIAGSAVGQRERVVLVEVADTWLVIGVAPGHITALHSMPKGEISASAGPAHDRARFSVWLRQIMERQRVEKQTIEKRQDERHGE